MFYKYDIITVIRSNTERYLVRRKGFWGLGKSLYYDPLSPVTTWKSFDCIYLQSRLLTAHFDKHIAEEYYESLTGLKTLKLKQEEKQLKPYSG